MTITTTSSHNIVGHPGGECAGRRPWLSVSADAPECIYRPVLDTRAVTQKYLPRISAGCCTLLSLHTIYNHNNHHRLLSIFKNKYHEYHDQQDKLLRQLFDLIKYITGKYALYSPSIIYYYNTGCPTVIARCLYNIF